MEREKNPNPTKDQHFMIDARMLQKIYDVSSINDGDSIVEIGGGSGNLTDYLIHKNNHVTVIEKDSYYALLLKNKYQNKDNVTVIEGDALEFNFLGYDRIIANLPYTITEAFLINLASSGVLNGDKSSSTLKSMTLVVSQNSLRKMVAPIQITEGNSKHFNQEFGLIGAICKSLLDIKIETPIPSSAFFPEPAVTSFLVTFTPKKKLTTVDRIMRELLTDKKSTMPHIGKIYQLMLNQGKIYKLNKHKYQSNQLVNLSFTSKNILDRNIYQLSNSQISQLIQDLIRNDINTKSKTNSNAKEELNIRDYFINGKFSYEKYQYDYEDYDEMDEDQLPIIKSEEKIKNKYSYYYDDYLYNLLLCRGLENNQNEEFQKKLIKK